MTKYYNKDIPDKIHAIYGIRQSGKKYYEMTKILTSFSPDEINCIKGMKYIITNLNDEDLKILVRILLGNRYNEFIERIRGKEK